jgi:hypothetical protein
LAYITGDAVWYGGAAEVAHRFPPKVAMLFTSAAEPVHGSTWPWSARTRLGAANAFPDATLVAAHNEGWVYLKETQDQLAEVFALFDLAGWRPRLRASYRGRARSAGR